ncbi:hypothetical protein FK535_19180 [Mycolicibacterium sp. 018/SC-01/001]|uniref:hypothetical protein n=1 Tax=Mycolicibacterium sp. 018/SC-01/001 TaxID=2592069 RepID=UPI001191DECB|nr:hypothetical protein [Mycolicibacterium sp. 018/SC-01/001]TRW80468.1 hypothetical protein FK535_19180 [Mycolicibacterium sp. 018/SC-01/001]
MFYFFLAACSFIFMVAPMALNPLGRILAGWSFFACLIYGLVLNGSIDNEIIPRALYAEISFDDGILTPQGITAILCFSLAVFAGIYGRKRRTYVEPISFRIQTPPAISVVLIAVALLISLYLLYELGVDTLLSYSGYGTIKDLGGRFEDNPLGKVIAGIYRPIIILLIVDATVKYKQRGTGFVVAAMAPISIAFVIGLAEGSRVTALYLLIFAGCSYIIGNKRAFFITLVPIVLCLAYSREARAHDVLGLSYVFEYLVSALNSDFFTGTISNIAGGHLATSATAEVARPELYSFDYKILSYLPSLGALDDFQIVKSVNEQRIADSFPFNAFGESWAFGLPFYFSLWAILFFSAKATIDSSRFGGTFHAVTNAVFIYGFLCATQYPVRNVFRYFYALLAIYFIAKWLTGRQRRQRDSAPVATFGSHLTPE